MTKSEAMEWIIYHGTLFPSWMAWIDGLSTVGRAAATDATARGLAEVALADAKAGSDGLLCGAIPRPFFVEEHVSAIVGFAKRRAQDARPHYTSGERSYTCRYCCDYGRVGVPSRRDGRIVWKACVCDRGDRSREGGMITFDPDREQVASTLAPEPRTDLSRATPAERAEARAIIAEARTAVTQAWESRFDREAASAAGG